MTAKYGRTCEPQPRDGLRRRSATSRRPSQARRGLSLLEAIIAIAILGGAMAVIGESVRLGTLAAADAQEYSMGQILAESKMAELAAGWQMLSPIPRTPLEVAPDWLYTVEVQPVDQQGLLAVAVTVERDPLQTSRPVSVTLYRWMIDPQLILDLQTQAAAAAEAASATGASSSSSGGAPTGGSGNG